MKNLRKQTATGPYRTVREDPCTLGHLHAMNHECPRCSFKVRSPLPRATRSLSSFQRCLTKLLLCLPPPPPPRRCR